MEAGKREKEKGGGNMGVHVLWGEYGWMDGWMAWRCGVE